MGLKRLRWWPLSVLGMLLDQLRRACAPCLPVTPRLPRMRRSATVTATVAPAFKSSGPPGRAGHPPFIVHDGEAICVLKETRDRGGADRRRRRVQLDDT